jgi:membrane-bound serine protease (ClpP class)
VSDVTTILTDPNVAFLLLVIGGLGLATELVHPNLLTGILGAAALLLAFVGLMGLPVNWLGLVLLATGFVLFLLETQIVSHGLLALGGVICVFLGASSLYNAPSSPSAEPVRIDPVVLLVTTAGMGLATLGLSVVAARSRRIKAPRGQLGAPIPVGTPGVVQAPLTPLGSVQLAGETWSARTPDERLLARATPVRLLGFEGLTALVEPLDADDPNTATTSIDPSAAPAAADRP